MPATLVWTGEIPGVLVRSYGDIVHVRRAKDHAPESLPLDEIVVKVRWQWLEQAIENGREGPDWAVLGVSRDRCTAYLMRTPSWKGDVISFSLQTGHQRVLVRSLEEWPAFTTLEDGSLLLVVRGGLAVVRPSGERDTSLQSRLANLSALSLAASTGYIVAGPGRDRNSVVVLDAQGAQLRSFDRVQDTTTDESLPRVDFHWEVLAVDGLSRIWLWGPLGLFVTNLDGVMLAHASFEDLQLDDPEDCQRPMGVDRHGVVWGRFHWSIDIAGFRLPQLEWLEPVLGGPDRKSGLEPTP